MRLFDPATVRQFFDLPSDPATDAALAQGRLLSPGTFDEAVARWAEERYPDADPIDRYSFAALVAELTTGMYGGWGTESYKREEQARDLVLAFAGGQPAPRDGIVAMTPQLHADGTPELPLPWPEWTRMALGLLALAYFERDPKRALDEAAGIVNRKPGAAGTLMLVREGLLRVVEKYYRPATMRELAARRRIVSSTCAQCGTPITGTKRRRYCSDACKLRASRARARGG